MPESIEDYQKIFTLRNHLCRFTRQELMNIYQDLGYFKGFVTAVALLANSENAFLLFSDEITEKISSVVQIHRFDTDDGYLKECINDIVGYLNEIKTYPQATINSLKNGYLAYQEDMRDVDFRTDVEFTDSLSYDAVVFNALQNGTEDQIKDDKFALISLNFLIKTLPEFFQDPIIRTRALSLLDRLSKTAKPFSSRKKYVKVIRANYEKMVSKEDA